MEEGLFRGGRRLFATGCSDFAREATGGANGAKVLSVLIGCFIQLETDAVSDGWRLILSDSLLLGGLGRPLLEDLILEVTMASNPPSVGWSAKATHSEPPLFCPPKTMVAEDDVSMNGIQSLTIVV